MAQGLKWSQLTSALLVTAAVLIAYRAGLHIALPGLEPKVVAQLHHDGGAGLVSPGGALARISILALEIFPLFSVLILAELAKVLVPSLRRWENAATHNAERLARILFILALLTACLQAAGVASGLEGISGLVTERGLQFRLTAIATLVAGTALVIWLAGEITRRGLGSGLWLILVAPTIAGLPLTLMQISQLQREGVVSGTSLVAAALFTVLAIAAVAALQLAGSRTASAPLAYAWTTILAYTLLTWLLGPLNWLAGPRGSDGSLPWAEPGHPVRLVTLAVILVLIAGLYARSIRLAGAAALAVPALVWGAALAVLAVGSELLPYYFGVPLPISGQPLIVIAIVATTILRDWGPPATAAGLSPPAQTGSSPAP